jgi:hypothetical protein
MRRGGEWHGSVGAPHKTLGSPIHLGELSATLFLFRDVTSGNNQ